MKILGEITDQPCIYKITSPSGRVYIGQTINYQKRIYNYRSLSCIKQKLLLRSFIKYGVENHIIEIVELVTIETINEREIFYIDFYKTNIAKYGNGAGLNLADGGYGNRGYKHTQETKDKISKSNIGKHNIPLSNEAKEKLRIWNTGRKFSEETKFKMSKSQKGKIVSNESKVKMSQGQLLNNKIPRRKVIDIETLVIYDSATNAAKLNNIKLSSLFNFLNLINKNKTNLFFLEDYNQYGKEFLIKNFKKQ